MALERKISGCVITVGEPTLLRALESGAPLIDEWVIVNTSKAPLSLPDAIGGKPVRIFDFEWVKDFAKARQFSFDKAAYPYAFWIDSDEILIGAADMRKVFEAAEGDHFVIYARTDYEKYKGKV